MGTKKLGVACGVLILAAISSFFLLKPGKKLDLPKGAKIIAFGDGFAAGTGATEGASFISKLQELLGITVENKAVDHLTTDAALSQFKRDILPLKPKVLLLTLGAGDLEQKIPLSKTLYNLESLIDELQRHEIALIYIGFSPPHVGDNWIMSIEQLLNRKNVIYAVEVMNEIWGKKELMFDDWYPNDRGHLVIAKKLAKQLSGVL